MNLAAIATVLRAAWRRPAWLELLAVGGAVVGMAVSTLARQEPLTVNSMVVGSLVLAILAMHLAQGVVRQNHPHLARLMPGQRSALQAALVAVLLLGWGGSALLWWTLTPNARPAMLFVVPIVMWISACLGMSRGLAALLLPALSAGALVAALESGLPKTEALWVAIGVSLPVMVLVLPLLLRRGDATHAAQWRRARNAEALMDITLQGGKLGALQGQSWLARLLGWWLWPTRRLVQEARHPVQSGAEALRRALWVTTPGLHIGQQGWMLVSIGSFVTAIAVLPAVLGASRHAAGPAVALGLGVGLMMWFYLLIVGGSLAEHWSTRGEQALMRLTPHTPQGQALCHGWAAVLRRHSWAGWLLHSGVALAFVAALQPAAWPHALAAVLVAAPAAWLLPLHRWANQRAPRGSWMGLVTLWAGACVAVVTVPLIGGPTLWALPAAAWALAALVAWRQRRHAAVTPWPAGHAAL